MEKQRMKTFRMVFLAMMVAIGVVISPILRIEGMCPTAHLINITCSVFMGPWYSLLCACMIGVIRMMFMGIPPLALTGAVFGAFISGVFYRASKGKIICAVLWIVMVADFFISFGHMIKAKNFYLKWKIFLKAKK